MLYVYAFIRARAQKSLVNDRAILIPKAIARATLTEEKGGENND